MNSGNILVGTSVLFTLVVIVLQRNGYSLLAAKPCSEVIAFGSIGLYV